MAKNIDILDSVNQKYDNGTSGLTATEVQSAIDEVYAAIGSPSLDDAVFNTYAVFNGQYIATSGAIDFSTRNKQSVDAATYPNITVTSPAGGAANFTLVILNSGSITSIAPAAGGNIQWGGGTPPTWAGRTILTLYYDGSSIWTGSAVVNTS